jgi:tetraacyldisaccharide 4'-kinase
MTTKSALILAPLGALYSAAIRARRALYKTGALRVHKIGAPVISVGNITTGGTGKTPLVEWIARIVAKEGRRVCILTRGFGRANESRRVLVSDGEHIFADAGEGGDEPLLLAENLRGVAAVVSYADRVAAARWAIENLKSELFILDDGFQHLRIARDLDLVVVDATNPWGGGKLLPRGRLREPLRELSRADCIILTRCEQAHDVDSLRKQAERLSVGRPVLLSRTRTRTIRLLDTAMRSNVSNHLPHHSSLISHPFAAFCAIGNPASFYEHIRKDGYTLKLKRSFADHHVYTQRDVDALINEARREGALALMTTAKDAVKLRSLRFDLPCYVLEIELEFDDEEKLVSMIREAISPLPGLKPPTLLISNSR